MPRRGIGAVAELRWYGPMKQKAHGSFKDLEKMIRGYLLPPTLAKAVACDPLVLCVSEDIWREIAIAPNENVAS